jgi:hypothetical protein
MAEPSVEDRLAAVERDLASLKLQLKQFQPKSRWISALRGTAVKNEAYAEISRLGKELRDAEPMQS